MAMEPIAELPDGCISEPFAKLPEGCISEPFAKLPEVCISKIISRTSPRDACRASSISSEFKSAGDSDFVWDQFLPPNYLAILSRSVSPVIYDSKKELYLRLSDSPVLLDGGTMSFSLDKESGKKCFMQSARELGIEWGDDQRYWNWTSSPDLESRFSEVAELSMVGLLGIRGKVETGMLSPKTTYAAYLVFKLGHRPRNLNSAKTIIRFLNETGHVPLEDENLVYLLPVEANTVYFMPEAPGPEHEEVNAANFIAEAPGPEHEDADAFNFIAEAPGPQPGHEEENGERPRERADGWKEIKMGEFFNDLGDNGEVEAVLMGIDTLYWKTGLFIQGFDFRPI